MKKTLYNILMIIERTLLFVEKCLRYGGKISKQAALFSSRQRNKFDEIIKEEREKSITETTLTHNMVTHPDEEYYAGRYWMWIEKSLGKLPKNNNDRLKILDLGCGQGRLTQRLARWSSRINGTVIGVDLSSPAIDFARLEARKEGLNNVTYVVSDIAKYLKSCQQETYHVVLCTEVLYMMPDYKEVLLEIRRILQKRGLLLVGFRSRYFNVLHSLKNRLWDALPLLLNSTEGPLWEAYGSNVRYSWFSISEAAELLNTSGFDVGTFRGLGVCSGIEGDPLAEIARPSQLSQEELEKLKVVEEALSIPMADCGRYLLGEALKRSN